MLCSFFKIHRLECLAHFLHDPATLCNFLLKNGMGETRTTEYFNFILRFKPSPLCFRRSHILSEVPSTRSDCLAAQRSWSTENVTFWWLFEIDLIDLFFKLKIPSRELDHLCPCSFCQLDHPINLYFHICSILLIFLINFVLFDPPITHEYHMIMKSKHQFTIIIWFYDHPVNFDYHNKFTIQLYYHLTMLMIMTTRSTLIILRSSIAKSNFRNYRVSQKMC